MKPEAQRIAIAKACGWKIEPRPEWPAYPFPAHTVTTPTGEFLGTISDEAMFKKLPDYLNDLNAMNDAEALLPGIGKRQEEDLGPVYFQNLYGVCYESLPQHLRQTWHDNEDFQTWMFVRATATQRAEAFLKTLGLWKDE